MQYQSEIDLCKDDSESVHNRRKQKNHIIRKATVNDASRIAEISVFTKRVNYRKIFRNDLVSFGEMQVYPLAKEYMENPKQLEAVWVYEDDFVKGFLHIDGTEIAELYVDSFFENQGIGGTLIHFAIEKCNCNYLWVLEKNTDARRFYARHGFFETRERKLEEGTTEWIIKLTR